jgi:acyl-CoA thioesterase YciA
VLVGDLVSFYADIIRVGRTSITVDVAVYAQRGAREGREEICIKVTEAELTYVAIDDNRRPRQVPDV